MTPSKCLQCANYGEKCESDDIPCNLNPFKPHYVKEVIPGRMFKVETKEEAS